MAEIRLTTKLDKTGIKNGFDDLAKAPEKFTKAVKKSATDSKKALDEVVKNPPKVPPMPPPVTPKETNAIRGLKKEIRDLMSIALDTNRSFEEQAAAIELAASKKADLRDLQDAVNALDPDVKAAAFTNLASTAVGAGQGIAGAFALAGIEGEEYQKILVRLQGIDAISQGIKSLGALKDEWGKVRIALNSYLLQMEAKIVADKVNTVVTAGEAVAESSATAATIAHTEAITAQTLAQRALNLVKAGTPWGAVTLLVGLATAAIAAYIANTEKAEMVERLRNKAADGTILANASLRDSYNKLILSLRKYSNDMKVARGEMTKYEAQMDLISQEAIQKNITAHNEYQATVMEEANLFETGNATLIAMLNGMSMEEVLLKQNTEARKAYNDTLKQTAIDQLAAEAAAKDEAAKEAAEKAEEDAKAIAESQQELLIERLNTQKVLLEAAGKDTLNIDKQIVNAEADLSRMRVGDVADAAQQIAIIEEQRKQKIIAIDAQEAEERKKIAQDLYTRIAEIRAGINKDDKKLSPEQLAKEELDANLKAIHDLGKEAAAQSQDLNAQDKANVEAGLQELVDESYAAYYEKLTDLRLKQNAAAQKQEDESWGIRLQRLNNSQQIELNQIELWNKEAGESEENFIRRKEEAKNQILLQFAQDRLAILQEQGIKGNEVEVSNLQVLIKQLRDKMAAAAEENKKNKKIDDFLKSLFGLTDEQLGDFKAGAALILEAARGIMQEQFDAREEQLSAQKEQNDRELDENQRRIDELNNQLEHEREEQAAGRANNIDAVQADIDRENRLRASQLQEQRKIQEEQKKLAKAKILADSAEQVSGLVTASANIFQVLSRLGPIGVGVAIATIAAMFTSFGTAKAKALQAAAPGFKTGTKKAPRGLKWVGEEGPELINDGGGYAIMNNKDSMALMEKYNMPAVYQPQIDEDQLGYFKAAASSGREAISVSVSSKGTEKRLDELIDMNRKSTVRTKFKRR